MPATLETQRLLFRPHEAVDLAAYCAIEADPVRRYVGGEPRSRAAAVQKFRRTFLANARRIPRASGLAAEKHRNLCRLCGRNIAQKLGFRLARVEHGPRSFNYYWLKSLSGKNRK